ncbi:MAG: tetratricopeptide repeat protein [Acidobacteriaceae bacterium]|nr:tetratricopeptide repeat protein [Acidobacteriaceae bacterium]
MLLLFLLTGLGERSVVFAQTTGQADASFSELQQAAKRFPQDARIQYNLGLALFHKGRLREAVAPLKKAAADPALTEEAHFLLGADYFEEKDYAAAIAELRQLDPSIQRERVLYMLEESNRRTGRLDEAKASFHELITNYSDSAWTHYLLGNAYEDQQELDKAIQEYKQALAKDPSTPNAEFAIGYLYWRQSDAENAREWLEKEAAKGCHSLANYYLGEISRAEKDLPKAESLYRRSLACDGSNSNAHLRLGMLLEEEKRYEEALAQLKEATRLAPDIGSGHYHLASVYRSLGRKAEAQIEFDKVRQIQAGKDNGVDVTRGAKE